MAFVVEDGTGVSGANSYDTVADALAYFTERGLTFYPSSPASAVQAALIRATDYIERTYSGLWKGERTTETQTLSWPRAYVYYDGIELYDDQLPPFLLAAVREAARLIFQEVELYQSIDDSAGRVRSYTQTVGPITERKSFDTSVTSRRFPQIDDVIAPLLEGSADIVKLRRSF